MHTRRQILKCLAALPVVGPMLPEVAASPSLSQSLPVLLEPVGPVSVTLPLSGGFGWFFWDGEGWVRHTEGETIRVENGRIPYMMCRTFEVESRDLVFGLVEEGGLTPHV